MNDLENSDDVPLPVMEELDQYCWECKECQWESRVTLITEPTLIVETD